MKNRVFFLSTAVIAASFLCLPEEVNASQACMDDCYASCEAQYTVCMNGYPYCELTNCTAKCAETDDKCFKECEKKNYLKAIELCADQQSKCFEGCEKLVPTPTPKSSPSPHPIPSPQPRFAGGS